MCRNNPPIFKLHVDYINGESSSNSSRKSCACFATVNGVRNQDRNWGEYVYSKG